MRTAEEILREHSAYVGAEPNFWPTHEVVAAIEQARREAIEEAAKLAEHNQDGGGGEWDSASLAIEEAIRALLPLKE